MSDALNHPNAGRSDRPLVEGPPNRISPAAVTLPLPVADTALPRAVARSSSAAVRSSRAGTTVAPVLVFDRVSKWYGPVIGLNQVTLELRPGITGLVGHNGAGKSTLLRLAAGLIRPDLGSVRVAGYDAWKAVAKRHLGYCPENDAFYEEWSGRRFVEAMAYLCGYARRDARGRAAEALKLVGMRDDADRPLASYSKGMRQRIKLAQALLHDPELVLLDEPLNGIDPIGRRDMLALFEQLAQRGKCLLISSHELDQIDKLTDHVIIMAAGRIAAVGTLSQIREVLDGHPLTVRIVSDANRRLAADLLALDEVVGVERAGDSLLVRVRQPNRFFAKIADLVLEDNIDIRHLETLDESTRDVLGYLLGEKSR